MKIVGVETLQAAEYGNLVWVRLHTDDGLIGLGETFRNPEATVAYVHETCAPYLIGKDPTCREQLTHAAIARRVGNHFNGFSRPQRRGTRQFCGRYRTVGSVRKSVWATDLPSARGTVPQRVPNLQHLREQRLSACCGAATGLTRISVRGRTTSRCSIISSHWFPIQEFARES